jgi:DNA-binding transcriptional regulator YhcF (GntR family)
MGSANIYTLLPNDEYSITPKYLQLSISKLKPIESGKLDKDDLLPSINDLIYEREISRDTGERAYKHLKKMDIVSSIPAKSYFIPRTDINKRIKNFLLFNNSRSRFI